MRRKDREVDSFERMLEILGQCDVCRLGLSDRDGAYIVPMNFGFVADEGAALTLFFHCAAEGRKLELIAQSHRVGFEADCGHELVSGERACDYSFKYKSVIGKGDARIVIDGDEKIAGLRAIMRHYSSNAPHDFSPRALDKTAVISLYVTEWSCKEHI